jgi:apolipoprotein N-acyltransferase
VKLTTAMGKVPASVWALAAGVAAALAQPPFGFLLGLLAYGGVMLLTERAQTIRGAFWRGWLAGAAYFGIGCWWVGEAFLVDAKTFGWMAPIAVAALAGGLALFWGAAGALYRALKPKGPARVLVFAGVFSLLEYGRGHLFTGFPWDLPGTSWPAGGPVSQAASLVGAYGLTWITLAVASAPAVLIDDWRNRGAQITVGVAAASLAGLFLFGLVQSTPQGSAGRVRIVQPNQPELASYSAADSARILADYVALTAQPRPRPGPITVIWPEGAIPDALDTYLATGTASRAAILNALQEGDTLMVGGYRVDQSRAEPLYYNSLAIFRREAGAGLTLLGVYDKRHLVPFGEYLPLKPILHLIGFQKLVPVGDGFSSGPAAPPLKLPDRVVQPLICYEALFPSLARQGFGASGPRPDLLVNVSTDAWFGATSGPWQHLNQAAYRAIEEGVPMLRDAPTGVSAVIDARGRIISQLGLGARGVIDADIPLAAQVSPYARAGDLFFGLMLAVSFSIRLCSLWFRAKIA